MNKIYKVIWSKVKHQYVVTSEFAHSCTKSTTSRAGRSAAAVLAALILTTGICAVPAQAADPTLEELYYEQLNSTVHNDETSSPVVKLVEAPTAAPTAAKDGEQAVDNDMQTGEDGGMTGAADQYTVVNEDGFYASNTKGTHNTLSKDGLWVGGTDDNTGFHVDNDGNVRTTGRVTATTVTGGTVIGETIQNANGSFSVDANGNVDTETVKSEGMSVVDEDGNTTFQVLSNGDVTAHDVTANTVDANAVTATTVTGGTVIGETIQNANGSFSVDANGNVDTETVKSEGMSVVDEDGNTTFQVLSNGDVTAHDVTANTVDANAVTATTVTGGTVIGETIQNANGSFSVDANGNVDTETVKSEGMSVVDEDGNTTFQVLSNGDVTAHDVTANTVDANAVTATTVTGGTVIGETIQNANGSFSVDANGNVDAETVKSEGMSVVDEDGNTTFQVLSNGDVTAHDVTANTVDANAVTATTVTGGTVIGETIQNANGSFSVDANGNVDTETVKSEGMSVVDEDGNTTFQVLSNGDVTAHDVTANTVDANAVTATTVTGGTVIGETIQNANGSFSVDANGNVDAETVKSEGMSVVDEDGNTTFQVLSNGDVTAHDVTANTVDANAVTATTVTGGTVIGETIQNANGSFSVDANGNVDTETVKSEGMSVVDEDGNTTFQVLSNGDVTAHDVTANTVDANAVTATTVTGGTVIGETIQNANGSFSVDANGNVDAETVKSEGMSVVDEDGNTTFQVLSNGDVTAHAVTATTVTGGTIQNADGSFSVDANGNVDAETVKSEGMSVVDEDGNTTFQVLANGDVTAHDVTATTVTGGTVIGETIRNTNNSFSVDANGNVDAETVKSEGMSVVDEDGNTTFQVLSNGDVTAHAVTATTVTGGTIQNADGSFSVDANGNVDAETVKSEGMSVVDEDGNTTFQVLANGDVTAHDVTATTVTGGTVIGETIRNTNNSFSVDANGNVDAETVKSEGMSVVDEDGNTTFQVLSNGDVTAHAVTATTVTGGTIQNADGSFSVDANGNVDAETVKSEGMSVVDEDGNTTFQVLANGDVTAHDVTATTVTGGTVIGETIRNTNNSFSVDANGNVDAETVKSEGMSVVDEDGNTTFQVLSNGDVTAHAVTATTVTGGTIQNADGSFSVDANGNVDAETVKSEGMSVVDEDGNTTFQVLANGDVTANSYRNANGTFTADETGLVTATKAQIDNVTIGGEDPSAAIKVSDDNFIVYNDGAFQAAGRKFLVNNQGEMTAAAATVDNVVIDNNQVTGLSNTTWNPDSIVEDRAATEGQLMMVQSDVQHISHMENTDGTHYTTVEGTKFNSDGSIVNHNDTFKVSADGEITAEKANIGGVILKTTAEDGKSKITAQKADIDGVWIKEGSITTEEGTITAGDVKINSTGSERINVGNGNFIVYQDGAFRAANDNFIVHKDGNVEAQGTVQAADATFAKDSRELVTAGQLYKAGIVPGKASGVNSMAIGTGAQALSTQAVAVGYNAAASGSYSVALGMQSGAHGTDSVALGRLASAMADDSVALGANSVANRANTVSVGSVGNERQITNVAAGKEDTDAVNVAQLKGVQDKVGDADFSKTNYAKTADNVTDAVKHVDAQVKVNSDDLAAYKAAGIVAGNEVGQYSNSIALGNNATVDGTNSIAIGAGSTADGAQATALGQNSNALGHGAVSLGANSEAVGEGAVSIGFNNSAEVAGSVAIGNGAHVYESGTNSVALGQWSTTSDEKVVSVGNDWLKRRITNVADGIDPTDAVNVQQLTDRTANMVEWDEGTKDTIHGVTLNGGTISAADGKFKVWSSGGMEATYGKFDGNIEAAGGNFKVNGTTGGITTAGGIEANGGITAANDNFNVWNSGGMEAAYGVFEGKITAANEKFEVNGATGDITTAGQITAANDKFHVWGTGGIAIGEDTANPLFAVNGYNGDVKTQGDIVAKDMYVGSKDDDNAVVTVGDMTNVVGDADFSDTNYASEAGNVTDAVKAVDAQVKSNSDALDSYEVSGIVAGMTNGENGVAIGEGSANLDQYGVAIGKDANTDGFGSVAIGAHAAVTGNDSVAIGFNSQAAEDHVVSVGGYTPGTQRRIINVADGVNEHDAVNVGQLDEVKSSVSIVGDDLAAYKAAGVVPGTALPEEAEGAMALGEGAEVRGDSDNALAIGSKAKANSASAVAIGPSATANGSQSLAFGAGAATNGANAVAIGRGANSDADNAIALGKGADAQAKNAVAFGAEAVAAGQNSVALGVGSKATEDNVVSVGDSQTGLYRQITNAAAGTDAHDVVTVGQLQAASDEATKTIHGVTLDNGMITAADGNFIVYESGVVKLNDGNLVIGTNGDLNSKGTITGNVLSTGGFVANADGNAEAKGTVTANTFSTGEDGFIANSDGDFEARNAHIDGTLLVGEKFKVTPEGELIAANSAFKVGADGTVTAVKGGSIGGVELKDGEVTGLNNTTWDAGNIVDDRAATEGQLAAVDERVNANSDALAGYEASGIAAGTTNGEYGVAIGEGSANLDQYGVAIGKDANTNSLGSVAVGAHATVTGNDSVAIGFNSQAREDHVVSVGGYAPGTQRRIINVAAGTADTDAVNVSQIKGMVRWDQAADDSYLEGTLRGVTLSEGTITAADGKFVVNNDPASDSDAILTIGGDNVFRINENGSIVASSGAFRVFSEGGFSAANGKFKVHAADGSVTTPLVTGLTNREWNATHNYSGSTLAATEAQLQAVANEAGKHTIVTANNGSETGNLKVTSAVNNGQTTYDISLSDTITMGDDTKGVTMDSSTIVFKNQLDDGVSGTRNAETNIAAGSLSIKRSESNEDRTYIDGASIMVGSAESGAAQTHITAKEITIGGDLTQIGATALRITNNGVNDRTITGLTNTTWNGSTDNASRAATEGQLAGLQQQVTADINELSDKFGKVDTNSLAKVVSVANQLDGANLSALSALSQIAPMSLDVPMMTNSVLSAPQEASKGMRDPDPNAWGNNVTTEDMSTINNNLTVTGDTHLKGDLEVDGEATFNDNVSIKGDLNMNNNKITGVADGKVSADSTDAVNGSQLYGVQQQVDANSQNISTLGGAVNKLGNRIDEVGAGAAALAALHPLDFDPDNKWDFSAGYGNYRGESAVAFGAFYRPNEDTMFSVGGTVGNDDNMVNAGVSIKIGSGSSGVTTSRVAMAKEIKAMRDVVAKQDAQIQKLTAMVNALVGVQAEPDTTTMFPDVPENHWAYEAVASMAKSGLVEGYPDGEFKGDRTMTRYEFAQIIQNAIQKGAEVDARLVQEFKPELEYFHIATVAKDKDGNPTIERVRAN